MQVIFFHLSWSLSFSNCATPSPRCGCLFFFSAALPLYLFLFFFFLFSVFLIIMIWSASSPFRSAGHTKYGIVGIPIWKTQPQSKKEKRYLGAIYGHKIQKEAQHNKQQAGRQTGRQALPVVSVHSAVNQ